MKNRASRWKAILIALPLLAVAGAVAASTYLKVRQGLAEERADIATAWRGVAEALVERAALIHDLAAAMRPSVAEAEGIAREIAALQAELQRGGAPQEQIRVHDRLSTALARLLEAGDASRRAKPSAAELRLEEQIKDSEGKIAVARRRYNETLEHYNARIQTFPNNLVARIAGFGRNDAYFRTEPF